MASSFAENGVSARHRILLVSAVGLAIFSAAALVAMLRQAGWEFPLVAALNSLANRSAALDRLVQALTVDQLLQGVAFIAILWYLWFATDDIDKRARLLGGFAAAACAGVLSRGLQLALPTHPRPLHTAALSFVMPAGVEPATLNHFNSFPSDHGAVFFALAIVIWRTKPWLGASALAWAVIVDVARVYEGYHWPSDIVGAFGLSLLVVSVFENQVVHRLACQLVILEHASRAWFYLAAFIVTYQVATLFDDVRQIGRGVALVVLHHVPFGGT
jgi:undecaprenyl-diphosphatase